MKFNKEAMLRYSALFFAMMASGGNMIVPREIWLILCGLSCLSLLNWRVPLFYSRQWIYIWIASVDILLLYLQGGAGLSSIISRTAVFFVALLLIEVYMARSVDRLMEDLFKILRWMSVQAILTYILGVFANGLFTIVTIDGIDYNTIGFVFNFHHLFDDVGRNIRPDGFFYEPGVFQIYLSIFLYLCLFWRLNFSWAVITCVAQLTLWSSGGLAVTICLLALAARKIYSNINAWQRLLIVPVYFVSFLFVVNLTAFNFTEKFEGELVGSHLARQYDFYTGINIVQEKPLTGIGFNRDTYLNYSGLYSFRETELSEDLTSDRPNSNGLIQALYTIGAPLGVILLAGIFRQRFFSRRLPFALILVVGFYAEAVVFTPFFLSILLSGMIVYRNGFGVMRLRE